MAGFTRCRSNPAARERARSSGNPYPVNAISVSAAPGGIGADSPRQLVSVHPRQADVDDRDVGSGGAEHGQRAGAVLGFEHLVACRLSTNAYISRASA